MKRQPQAKPGPEGGDGNATQGRNEQMPKTRIEIDLSNVHPGQLSKEDLGEEMLLLHTTAVKIGQRHTALMREWDRRQVKAALSDVVQTLSPKQPPMKRRV